MHYPLPLTTDDVCIAGGDVASGCGHDQILLIFVAYGYGDFIGVVERNVQDDWPATHLTILDVLLGTRRAINKNRDEFAAEWAVNWMLDYLSHLGISDMAIALSEMNAAREKERALTDHDHAITTVLAT